MSTQTEKREFTLDRNAISILIQAQAGSLQKAILEAVANALDAGASKVKVNLSAKRVVIEDDGRGFRSKEELGEFFDRFGFDHSQLDRKVGRFGVGRGQLFHFGRNLWTTNGFTMDVDTKKDMFGYELGVAKNPHKGVRIEIDLYEELNFSQLTATETEFKKLVKFCAIPVLLNGKTVSKDPAKVKWDAETDDAWFMLDDSYSINVYSQGLFVQSLGSYQFGKGGLVVTKMGHPLKQNMARNDTLTTDCEVWKRVRKTLDSLTATHRKKASKSKTMTEALRGSLSTTALAAENEDGLDALLDTPLFTTTNGRHVKLLTLLEAKYVASAPAKDPAGDLLMQRKQAMVLAPMTLSRCGVETVAELAEKIDTALKRARQLCPRNGYHGQSHYERSSKLYTLEKAFKACKFVEKVSDLPMTANVEIIEVKDREASKDERLALSLIRRELMPALTCEVLSHLDPTTSYNRWSLRGDTRRVQLAVSEAFLACTDGATKIWIDRGFLSDCIAGGPSGFIRLANVLVHELLHDRDTSTGHDHDHDFYQAYHDVTMSAATSGAAFHVYRTWLARGGKASAYAIKEMERAQLMDSEVVESRREALANPEQAARQVDADIGLDVEVVSAAPTPSRPSRRRNP